jgi:hypothetical protein
LVTNFIDRDTGEIVKYGEITEVIPSNRYSSQQYVEMNARMVVVKKGRKCEMHAWQHEQILTYKLSHDGNRPKYNFNDH